MSRWPLVTLTRREFLAATSSALGLAAVAHRTVPTDRPNLLFILADDLGYGDLSAFGRPDYETTNLDRMAREGVRFDQAYSAASVCTPTRAGFITGRYPARLPAGLQQPMSYRNDRDGLPPGHPTIASFLKTAGYDTALIGKWHLGLLPRFSPTHFGFDEFFGILGGGVDYYSHKNAAARLDLHEGLVTAPKVGYLTDLLTERAVAFVTRRRQRPFYLSLHYTAPHWPWQGPGDYEPDTVGSGFTGGGSPQVFAGMVQSLDAGVGTVLAALARAGIERQTLVIFTSDNGGERYSFNWPHSEHKGTLWEGGIHIPAIALWPGVIPPGRASDQVAVTMDWTATFLKAAGVTPDSSYPLDGVDLLPVARGAAASVERTVFWRQPSLAYNGQPPQEAVRRGRWKYLSIDGREHLFDISVDPGEKADRKGQYPQTLATLKEALAQWEAGLPPRSTDPKSQ